MKNYFYYENTLRSTLFSISSHAPIRGFWKYEKPTPVKFLQFKVASPSFSPFTSIIPYLRGKIAGNEHRKFCCFWPKTWNQISFSTFKDVERRRLIPTKLLLLRKSRDDCWRFNSTWFQTGTISALFGHTFLLKISITLAFCELRPKCRYICKALYYHTCKIIHYPLIIDEYDIKLFSINHTNKSYLWVFCDIKIFAMTWFWNILGH